MESPHIFCDKMKGTDKEKEKKARMKRLRAVGLYKEDDGHFYFNITTTTDKETNQSLYNLYSYNDRKSSKYKISSLTIDLDRYVGKVVDIVCKKIVYDFYATSPTSGERNHIRGTTIRVMELYATS